MQAHKTGTHHIGREVVRCSTAEDGSVLATLPPLAPIDLDSGKLPHLESESRQRRRYAKIILLVFFLALP